MDKEKIIKNSFDILRCILYALVVSVFLVLVFALIIKLTGMSANVVNYINQGIKVISVLIAIIIGLKERYMGAAKGALIGLIYTLLSFLIFKLLASQAFSLTIFDILIGIVVGLISGIIAVNVKKIA